MKGKTFVLFLTVVALVAFYSCMKNPLGLESEVTDEAAIKELIEGNPELFNVLGIDDDGAQDPEYSTGFPKPAEPIVPIRFGRKGHFRLEEIDVEFSAQSDTAWVTVVRSFDGNFMIIARDTTTSPPVAHLYKKPMGNTITRKAMFVKVADTANPRRNWKLRGLTMSECYSDTCTITIHQVRIVTPDTELVVTAPLDYFMPKEEIPTVSPGDTVKVFLTLSNTEENPPEPGETVLLRYRTDHRCRRARRTFNDEGIYPDEVAGDGIYSGFWVVHQHRGIYHAYFDVIDNGTIYDDTLPYNSAVWGTPYVVK